MDINRKKIKHWVNDHKKQIIIVAGTVVVVGGAIAVGYHFHQVGRLRMENRILNEVIIDQAQEMAKMRVEHHELCMQKDAAHRALASDALRHGSSMGAEEMASWKAYKKTAGTVA